MTRILTPFLGIVIVRHADAWATMTHDISHPRAFAPLFATNSGRNLDNTPRNYGTESIESNRRRQFGAALLAGLVLAPQAASAGEVGARITEAVTQSDLGVSVRKSVVRGAQVFDQVDGQWEQFSDRFGLGSERSRQGLRPKPKVIPDPKPLDSTSATQIIDLADATFIGLAGISAGDLQKRIAKIEEMAQPSFERSGLIPSVDGCISTGDQFNFASYVHFKAYGDFMVKSKRPFAPFYKEFTSQLGQKVLSVLAAPQQMKGVSDITASKERLLKAALRSVDDLCESLVSKGLVAATDKSEIDSDRLLDWVEDDGDLQLSVALDGDITRGAQILLQEQGFRLYPNYGRFAISSLLSNMLPAQKVTVDEYYMDTDYNTDPNLYEVKEVLLNIVIENQ